jgi:hypothetical protein
VCVCTTSVDIRKKKNAEQCMAMQSRRNEHAENTIRLRRMSQLE